jgi:nucleoredoxin
VKNSVVHRAGLTSNPDVIRAFYFSAHWCPPCRNFTPILADMYNRGKNFIYVINDFFIVNKEKKVIEIMFVSSDSSYDAFKSYTETMPWISVDYNETELINELKNKYNVQGIPYLVIVD